MVPRARTTKVDSAGWNIVVGAWNNMIRFIRAISVALDMDCNKRSKPRNKKKEHRNKQRRENRNAKIRKQQYIAT